MNANGLAGGVEENENVNEAVNVNDYVNANEPSEAFDRSFLF